MRQVAFCLTLVGSLTLYSCNSSEDENNTRAVEEKEDMAKEAADEMEDKAENNDTTAVQIEQ